MLGRVVLPVSVVVSGGNSVGSLAFDGFPWLSARGTGVREGMLNSKLTTGEPESDILLNPWDSQ